MIRPVASGPRWNSDAKGHVRLPLVFSLISVNPFGFSRWRKESV